MGYGLMSKFYLKKVLSSLSCNIPVWSCGPEEDFKILLDYLGNNAGFNRPFGKNSGFVSRLLIRHDSTPGFYLTNDTSASVSWPLPNGYTAVVDSGEFYRIELIRVSGIVEFVFNGVSQGTRALSGPFNIERVFIQGGTHDLLNNAIKTLEFTNLADSRYYQNTSGVGPEWIDTISGKTGMVQSPPTDNSHWVPYDDGLSPALIVPKVAIGGQFITGQFKVKEGGIWVPASARIV